MDKRFWRRTLKCENKGNNKITELRTIFQRETDKISQHPENCENRNDPELVQAFLKKWWVESDFKVPNLLLSLRFKGEKLTDDGRQVMAKAHISIGKVSLKTWWKKKYSYNVVKFIFDMRANQDHISVLIRIKPDIWKVRM